SSCRVAAPVGHCVAPTSRPTAWPVGSRLGLTRNTGDALVAPGTSASDPSLDAGRGGPFAPGARSPAAQSGGLRGTVARARRARGGRRAPAASAGGARVARARSGRDRRRRLRARVQSRVESVLQVARLATRLPGNDRLHHSDAVRGGAASEPARPR